MLVAGFAAQYIASLCAIGALLLALYAAGKFVVKRRVPVDDSRLVSLVETTPLHAGGALHVVRIAQRFYVVGAGGANVAVLCEIDAQRVHDWSKSRRTDRSG